VLAEIIGPHDLSLDPADVDAGYAAPLAPLRELCEQRGLALIEDAAHSPDATVPGGDEALGINEFSAYAGAPGAGSLPRCERAARCQLTLPLYQHLGEERLDPVVRALRDGLSA
jgi:dTDP-4-amino-4,6-dideoxygalactose transaminase